MQFMKKPEKHLQKWRLTVFKRWAVLYLHDGAPVDGAIFIHKAKAIEFKANMKNSSKYKVAEVQIKHATTSA